jgi:hypothetical protein
MGESLRQQPENDERSPQRRVDWLEVQLLRQMLRGGEQFRDLQQQVMAMKEALVAHGIVPADIVDEHEQRIADDLWLVSQESDALQTAIDERRQLEARLRHLEAILGDAADTLWTDEGPH